MMQQKERTYRMIYEYKDAWKPESFRERYSEVLDRYDFIVGDWGYNQLRLKGFFRDDNPKATKETSISHLQDYLQEYCNFGCAYFVIEKVNPSDRLNLDLSRPEQSITISELPMNDRYAEWKAFLDKLQEEREQQKDDGEKQGRRTARSGAASNGAGGLSGNGRKSESAFFDRQETGIGRSSGPGRQPADETNAKPAFGSGVDKERRRQETGGRPEKRPNGEPQNDRQGKRRGEVANARQSSPIAGNTREARPEAGQQGRQADRNRPSFGAADIRQENGSAAHGEARNGGKPAHKRPWHKNRKSRQNGKPDRLRQAGPDGKIRSDGSAGDPS